MSDPSFDVDPLAVADSIDNIASHISETLYYAGGAIAKAYSLAGERCIRDDDYDLLRKYAKEIRRAEYLRLAEMNT